MQAHNGPRPASNPAIPTQPHTEGGEIRGLLVDESQLPAAVLSEIAFTVRSLAFTD